VVDGRAMLAFCSNDYLGLAAHPRVVEALREGAALYGAGSGASHLVSGHSRAHALLEERLAAFEAPHLEAARALYFCTGYMANLAVLTALGSDADAMIFSEALNHASLIDGARLARAGVAVYPHGDVAALEAQLGASTAATRSSSPTACSAWTATWRRCRELLAVCERHGAWLVVDDAHGFGVLGADTAAARSNISACARPTWSMSARWARRPAWAAPSSRRTKSVIELLVQRARPYIYTTAAAPALAHALLASVDIIEGDEGRARRARLQALIAQLDRELRLERWQRPASNTAIQPIIIGANDEALAAPRRLHEQGLWVPAIRPPTVAPGTARLRVTLSAAIPADDVAQLPLRSTALKGTSM
jgi:8-amino-7-oxononanoate synthase